MSSISPHARTNLEHILREVDVLCKETRIPTKERRRGRPCQYTDSFILKLVVIQYLLGFTSERSFLRFIPELRRKEFIRIPDQSQYNRRARRLYPFVEAITQHLNQVLPLDTSTTRILDTTPVPVVKMSRARRRKIFQERKQVGIGYCAAQRIYYCGVKLNLFIYSCGIPAGHYLKPANYSDIRCLEEILIERQPLANSVVIADKGYISKHAKQWMKQCWNITLLTDYRKNQKQAVSYHDKILLKQRKLIETVIGQLKDQMGLERLRAKTYQGLQARIDNLIFTYLFGVYFNIRNHRKPLCVKSILT